ncbi:hypothetical protein D3C72_1455910 [compost metagenome]
MDQPGHHAAAPGAGVHVALGHHLRVDAGDLVHDVVDLQRVALGALDLHEALHARVVDHALGVAQRPHDQARVEFRGVDDGLLHVGVHRRFLGGDEARAHVHALGAQRERSHEAAAIGHAARGDERDLQFFCRARQQDHVGHVVLAGVAAALEAVDAHGVAADALGLERVAHRGALVDHLDARGLQRRHVGLGAAARGFHGLDAAFDDGRDVLGVRRRGKGRQEGEVHAEGLVGHLVAARDLAGQQLGRLLREARDDPQAAGVGDGRGQLGKADVVHAALDDGVADAEEFGDAGFQGNVLWSGLLEGKEKIRAAR